MDYLPLSVYESLVELTKEGIRMKREAIILPAPVLCGVIFFELEHAYPIDMEKDIAEIYDSLARIYRDNKWSVKRERNGNKSKRQRALIINKEITLSSQPGLRQEKNTPIRVEVDSSGCPVLRINLWRI